MQETARRLLPREKQLQKCHCTRVRGGYGVQVYTSARGASFAGLVQCGSIWICPVCASKESAVRADEMQRGIDYAIQVGHGVQMVTLTHRHTKFEVLAEMRAAQRLALRFLKSGRAYADLQRRFGLFGEIRALEITHGDRNGWHPHTHALMFTNRPLTDAELFEFECRLYLLWRAACARAGLGDPTFEHGVHVRPAKYAADYVAKWGFARELAQAHLKRAKGQGRTPWQLLADAGDSTLPRLVRKRAAWLFREFAAAFKGSRQLFYSPGLRQRLGLNKKLTDQMALALPDPKPRELVCTIEPDQWRLVVRYRMHAEVLAAAEQGAAAVTALLERLRRRVLLEVGTDGTFDRLRWYDRVEGAMVRV